MFCIKGDLGFGGGFCIGSYGFFFSMFGDLGNFLVGCRSNKKQRTTKQEIKNSEPKRKKKKKKYWHPPTPTPTNQPKKLQYPTPHFLPTTPHDSAPPYPNPA